ncbi:MAG: LysR family transcriptional regulator [Anaeromyxobacteraceae bacterium]
MAEWDDLRILLAVQRAGSLTAAAAALGCSQPTVSRRVAALAKRYGTALLVAEGGRYVPSPAGRNVLERAERIEREVHAIAREIDRLDERPHGAVRLSAPEGLGLAVVAPRLAAFRREHPGLDLLLVAESPVVNLSRREADLALRFVRPRQRDLVVRRVARVPFAPYATPGYLRDHPREPGALLTVGEDVIALHEALADQPEARWFRAQLPLARVHVRVRTTLALASAIKAGAGVGVLPEYLGDDPALVPLRVPGPPFTRDVYLVFHRALRGTTRVRIASRFAAECMEKWRVAG